MYRPHGNLVLAAVLALTLVLSGLPAAAAAPLRDFPPADSAYHSYAEMVGEINAVAAAHREYCQPLEYRQVL